ncbi:hypothetical protein O181_067498 [Austropuccinia psidii MF-1]|uniref:Uncharacterized protein n=1 Tax=Austropuccinia psidii MF-1 TaxID=1389203 RepID=A0A9Q3I4K4_9BASI|nr:hypothetical protein [Austropuccinia psidii MF-1]
MPHPMPQTLGSSLEFNELQTSTPESGDKISDMVSNNKLVIEVKSLEHENYQDPPVIQDCEHTFILNICNLSEPDSFLIAFISAQPPSSQRLNLKSYEKEKAVEPCEPTEDAG